MPRIPITPPRVPLIDPRTGLIDRAWYLFFANLFTEVGNLDDTQISQSTESLISSYDAALAALANDIGSRPVATENVYQTDPLPSVVTYVPQNDPVPVTEPPIAQDAPLPAAEQYIPQDVLLPATEWYIPQDDLTPASIPATDLTGPISSRGGVTSITSQTGTGTKFVVDTSPTLITPILGTPTSGTLTNCTGLPIGTGISGLGTGVATALAINIGTAGSPVVRDGALGTPSSGTVTNLTGTASININGTVGATTPAAGTFTTLTSTGNATIGDAEASDSHAIKGATTLLVNSASPALKVTQTGAGNAILVEDSASTDSTPFAVTGAGIVTAGYTASIPGAFSDEALVQSVVAGGAAQIAGYRFSANTGGTNIYLYKSRAATAGTNTVVQSGDTLGVVNFAGADGTTYHRAATIAGEVDGTPGASDMPGRLVFGTTADGASSPTIRMTISSAGVVTLTGSLVSPTIKASNVAGYISSDGSTGYTGTVTTALLVGKTITIKDGLITGFA